MRAAKVLDEVGCRKLPSTRLRGFEVDYSRTVRTRPRRRFDRVMIDARARRDVEESFELLATVYARGIERLDEGTRFASTKRRRWESASDAGRSGRSYVEMPPACRGVRLSVASHAASLSGKP